MLWCSGLGKTQRSLPSEKHSPTCSFPLKYQLTNLPIQLDTLLPAPQPQATGLLYTGACVGRLRTLGSQGGDSRQSPHPISTAKPRRTLDKSPPHPYLPFRPEFLCEAQSPAAAVPHVPGPQRSPEPAHLRLTRVALEAARTFPEHTLLILANKNAALEGRSPSAQTPGQTLTAGVPQPFPVLLSAPQ